MIPIGLRKQSNQPLKGLPSPPVSYRSFAMIHLFGSLALALCAADPASEAPSHPLMSAVPADSVFVASCDDPSALRANLLSNQMVRLFDGGSGTPYVTAITDLVLSAKLVMDEDTGHERFEGLVSFSKLIIKIGEDATELLVLSQDFRTHSIY